LRIAVYVRPNARHPQVGGSYAGCLVVKVAAPAIEGAANDAVLAALAESFEVSKRSLQILHGRRSPRKMVAIDLDEATCAARLDALMNQTGA
jgi:uncharacterized protein YggU (UPF0235/DUF167 family)